MIEKKKYARKNKKMLSIYVDTEMHNFFVSRAKFRGMTLTQWVLLAITERIEEENKYL